MLSSPKAEIQPGNALPLRSIPVGTIIHNIEMKQGKGAQLARAAGSYGQLMAKEGTYIQIRLSSGEVRLIHIDCLATVGQVGKDVYKRQVKLIYPIAMEKGLRFAIREGGRTVGAGVVTDIIG